MEKEGVSIKEGFRVSKGGRAMGKQRKKGKDRGGKDGWTRKLRGPIQVMM